MTRNIAPAATSAANRHNLKPQAERITETPANRVQLEKILASQSFGGELETNRETEFLKHLANTTMRGVTLVQKDVASDLGLTFGNIGTIKRRTLVKLEDYYKDEGRADPILFDIPPRQFYVTGHPNPAAGVQPRPLASTEDELSHEILLKNYAQLVKDLCDAEGTTKKERDDIVWGWVEAQGQFVGELPQPSGFDAFIQYLQDNEKKLTLAQMRSLARDLGIHPIMLDPLLSKPIAEDCLILRLPTATQPSTTSAEPPRGYVEGCFSPRGGADFEGYGFGAQYWAPDIRMAGTDAAFVYLILNPKDPEDPGRRGGYSDDHHHPGDELVLVLRGSVHVCLRDSGLEFELKQGSYVHFYAEQTHSAHNESMHEPAHLFIIRFYQSGVPGTRQEIRRELWNATAGNRPAKAPQLDKLTWGWILGSAADRSIKGRTGNWPWMKDAPEHVLNSFGLARLLRRVEKIAPARTKAQETEFLKDIKAPAGSTLEEWLWQLETQQVKLSKHLVQKVSELYGLFEFLTFEFLFPSFPRQVVVRRRTATDSSDDWADLRTVAGDLTYGSRYEIPTRSLACSDIVITWLTLEQGTVTPGNVHPGCELLLPIEGDATIEYVDERDPPERKVSAQQQIAHYRSDKKHRVRNPGKRAAQMFIIRFYGEDPGKKGDIPGGVVPVPARKRKR